MKRISILLKYLKYILKKKSLISFSKNYKHNQLPVIDVIINNNKYKFIIDTGAFYTIVSKDLYDKIKDDNTNELTDYCVSVSGLDGVKMDTVLFVTSISFDRSDSEYQVVCQACDNIDLQTGDRKIDGLLGYHFLANNNAVLDLDKLYLLV